MGRALLTDDHAAKIVAAGRALTPYRPSNGTEGDMFMERWCCDGCRHYGPLPEIDDETRGCALDIDLRAMFADVDDPDYPREWRYGPTGQPECTAFLTRRDDA